MKIIKVTSWDNKITIIPVDQILLASENLSGGSEIVLDTAFHNAVLVKEDILRVQSKMEKPEGEDD